MSQEAYGKYHQRASFNPIVIKKSDEVKHQIKEKLNEAFMFSALEAQELNIVIDAMDVK